MLCAGNLTSTAGNVSPGLSGEFPAACQIPKFHFWSSVFPGEKQKPGNEAQVTLVACTLCIIMAIFESAQGKYSSNALCTTCISTQLIHVTKYTVIPFSTDVLQFGYLQCFLHILLVLVQFTFVFH